MVNLDFLKIKFLAADWLVDLESCRLLAGGLDSENYMVLARKIKVTNKSGFPENQSFSSRLAGGAEKLQMV